MSENPHEAKGERWERGKKGEGKGEYEAIPRSRDYPAAAGQEDRGERQEAKG
jgi:hypothetical protein